MFTVKVREERTVQVAGGAAAAIPEVTETIFEAKQVRFADRKVYCDVDDGQITYHQRDTAPEDHRHTLYVMNRDGATVAVYHL